jgi:hypothetical protein
MSNINVPDFRAAAWPGPAPSPPGVGPTLGPLQDLLGTWVGTGFNLIARPDKQDGKPFFLEVNATQETLTFTAISAPIPNRGSLQGDIEFLGVHYLQQVSDVVTNGALHIEPGIWLNVPSTEQPAAGASVVRLATIPHGDALLAQGTSITVPKPLIQATSPIPVDSATQQPKTEQQYIEPYSTTPAPGPLASTVPGAVQDPNSVIQAAIGPQNITNTVVLGVKTVSAADGTNLGIQNIPFVVQNANALSLEATFWIETVDHPQQPERQFLQLQYTQRIMLRFDGIDWPHISVATLIKQ